jgi:hypothetical protein
MTTQHKDGWKLLQPISSLSAPLITLSWRIPNSLLLMSPVAFAPHDEHCPASSEHVERWVCMQASSDEQ